ncbi:prostasin-like [Anopheles aquasalis]|uniref:prostasin-like n=1 Tax=Anopheles aquasalis TaxID=42839 RepID=UPI00215B5CF1|nr:prostasin-like [Anopheles aquasalis]
MVILGRVLLVLLIVALVDSANISPICGKRQLDETTLLPEGQTLPGQIPWHVSIYRYSEFLCGGSIVSPRLVITFAHLLAFWQYPSAYHFTAGLYDLENTTNSISYNVSEVIVHPEFIKTTSSNDIAILRAASDILLGEPMKVLPICLPNGQAVKGITGQELLNQRGILAGWEHPENVPSSSVLKWKAVRVIDLESCREKLPEKFHYALDNEAFCASRQDTGANIYPGDGGGGLAFIEDGVWYLHGLFSFAPNKLLDNGKVGFNQSGVFGFTDIARYIPWINENLSK